MCWLPGRPRRESINPEKKKLGAQCIESKLNSIYDNFAIVEDDSVEKSCGMGCDAIIYTLHGDSDYQEAATGTYTPSTSTHAEINALSTYIAMMGRIDQITAIKISSPPCKQCAFVLKLLGLGGLVVTRKATRKIATGSWKWPDNLKSTSLFDPDVWNEIVHPFCKSGMDEAQIVEVMVKVVSSGSSTGV